MIDIKDSELGGSAVKLTPSIKASVISRVAFESLRTSFLKMLEAIAEAPEEETRIP